MIEVFKGGTCITCKRAVVTDARFCRDCTRDMFQREVRRQERIAARA